jgi:hypothetical protein
MGSPIAVGYAASVWFLSSAAAQVIELPDEDPLVSLRLRAMGGAATGLAESASANLENPAAIGTRRSPADQSRLDPDLTLQARDHPLLAMVFGTPDAPYRSAYFQVAANVRYERGGFAIGWRETRVSDGDVDVGTFLASPGAAYAGSEWVVGLVPHVYGLQADGRGLAVGFGATAGASWSPPGQWRLGASFRPPLRSGVLPGAGPTQARLPLEAQVGAVWSPGFRNEPGRWGPTRERQASESAALVVGEVVLTGDSAEAVVLAEGDDTPETSGTTVSPRVGVEGWLLDDRLRLRGGAGVLAGRGGTPLDPFGAAGVAWAVVQDPRGFAWRAVVGGEWYAATGPAIGIGLETW